MHLADEQVQRLLHHELDAASEAAVRAHAAGCAACSARIDTAETEERELFELLRHLDHALPAVSADTVIALARVPRFAWSRWAAGLLLALGAAGVAYAVPGSSLSRWMATSLDRVRSERHSPAAAPLPDAAEPAGIALDPGIDFVIVFSSAPARQSVRVLLSDAHDIEVRARNNTGGAFRADVARLMIDNVSRAATFEIRIPRTAPRVEIRTGELRIFLKQGPRIITHAAPDGGEIFLLPP